MYRIIGTTNERATTKTTKSIGKTREVAGEKKAPECCFNPRREQRIQNFLQRSTFSAAYLVSMHTRQSNLRFSVVRNVNLIAS